MTTVVNAESQLLRALSALERSRLKLEAVEREKNEAIAIVGIGCRLPGDVTDIDSYWSLLESGGDAVSVIPEARWQLSGTYDKDRNKAGKIYSDAMGFMEGADRFDAAFFGISAREAERMDPQQRVLLEVAFEAIEHAGMSAGALRGTTAGVFVGICANDFSNRFPLDSLDTYSATGRSLATASGRLSYTFGLQGPSLSVDTACSSSLVAVHLACQSLRRGESNLAFAGGVHITAGAETSVSMAKLNALSPSGRCRAFSADADGYVRGEGCVILVLKRLSDALKDRDQIYACIKASAINQDGRSNGLTAPNGVAQAALLRACMNQAKLQPQDIGYLEAHGTGTELGDPIELNAVASVYGEGRNAANRLWVGSGKTNIGHLEAAAGVAGLLRAVLAIHHATIPPNLHFRAPNPHLDWESLPLHVPLAPTPFPANSAGSRMAAISSFGFSGTNAHVIVEQAPQTEISPPRIASGDDLLLVSAASESALHRQAERFASFLREGNADFRDICRTSRYRRSRHAERIAVIGSSAEQLAERLDLYAKGGEDALVQQGRRVDSERGVVAVFSGHGSQWWGMGRELYEARGVFMRVFDDCDAAIRAHSGRSVRTDLFASESETAQFDAAIVQPLLFAVTVALAGHMRSLGVPIGAVVGQSMGEVAAAAVSEALSLDDAARIICARSRLAVTVKDGAMGMIELGLTEVEELIREERAAVSIAASNGPRSTLVSGNAQAIAAFIDKLKARDIFCRQVRIDYASHSAFMDPLLEPLKQSLAGIVPRKGRIPMYSTVTGTIVEGETLTPEYWAANLREPVLFYPTLKKLIADGYRLFLEVAPRPTLSFAMEDALAHMDVHGCVAAAMRDGQSQQRTALISAAKLFVHGADMHEFDRPPRLVNLPTYPWEHTVFPLPSTARTTHETGVDEGRVRSAHQCSFNGIGAQSAPYIDSETALGPPRSIAGQHGTWIAEGILRPDHQIVAEHRVNGSAILPGAGFIRMALQTARQRWPSKGLSLSKLTFKSVLATREDKDAAFALQLHLEEDGTEEASWRISSQEEGEMQRWTEYAKGRVGVKHASFTNGDFAMPSAVQDRMHESAPGSALYDALRNSGLDYGPHFRMVENIWWNRNEFLARLTPSSEADNEAADLSAYTLDASLHGLAWLGCQNGEPAQVPVSISEIVVAADTAPPVWVHGMRTVGDDGDSLAELKLWDAHGKFVARISGLRATNPERTLMSLPEQGQWLHRQEWIEQPLGPDADQSERDWMIVAATGCAVSEDWLHRLRQRLNGAALMNWNRADGADALLDRMFSWLETRAGKSPSIAYLGASVGASNLDTQDHSINPEVCNEILSFLQALLRASDGAEAPQVCFITEGTQAVSNDLPSHAAGVSDAAIWGFARALTAENPELRCRCIDLGYGQAERQLAELADELLSDSNESELALRAVRHVGRLVRSDIPPEAEPDTRLAKEFYRLEIDKPGMLGSLKPRSAPRIDPAPGEVEIEIDAAALNFADVMRAMGFFLAPGEHTVALGSECAGVISRMGAGVTGLRIGQKVVAIGAHCFASHVNVSASCVVPLPDGMQAAEAAGVPIASMTAWYALKTIASLQPGDRILIHSATGGTGLAAVQLARALGAEVIATAGSESKRQILREMGIRHVFDSRGADFAKHVLDATGGAGVDVVLNSLSGHAIEQNLRVLAPDGCFLELGKRDIYEGGRLPLHHFKKRIRYAAIDLAGLQRERPEKFAALFKQVMAALENKQISALPITVFPVSKAHEAFQHMAGAQHVGKLILNMRDEQIAVAHRSGPAPLFRGTQLITGGLGGLGLALADWMIEHGAAHVVLMSRSAPDAAALERLEEFRRRGAMVRTLQADVASRAQLADCLKTIEAEFPPVRGVFHLAGVLRDGLVGNQTEANFQDVLRPKIDGAWNLHTLTSGHDLDYFVLYSSAAVLLPSASQTNYAAANAFLDALASYRRQHGLPSLSVQWGPFSGVGLAAASGERGERLAERGAASITVDQAHQYLGAVMKSNASVLGVFPLNSSRWLASNPAISALPRFDLIRGGAKEHPDSTPWQHRLNDMPASQRLLLLEKLLQRHAAAILRMPESAIVPNATFQQIGLDSLTGLELRNRIEGETGLRLPSAVLWRQPSVRALAEFLCEQVAALTKPAKPTTTAVRTPEPSDHDKWFLIPRRLTQPRLRIFCLPFLGGLGAVFSHWLKHLPDDIELYALQLPGRPPRHSEQPFANYRALIDALLEAMPSRLDVPYVIYGHSLGALVSFGLVHALRSAGAPLPKHLCLAAYPAPHLHNPIGEIAHLPEAAFIQGLIRLRGIPEQVLQDRDLLSVFLPSLRAELQLLNSYVHVPREPLDVPVTILGGSRDHLVQRHELEAWRQHFTGAFHMQEIEGGHFFVREAEQSVVRAVLEGLMTEQD